MEPLAFFETQTHKADKASLTQYHVVTQHKYLEDSEQLTFWRLLYADASNDNMINVL